MREQSRTTLAAAVSRVLPSDDGAGAVEAGAPEYLEIALDHRCHRSLRPVIERGLDALESMARDLYRQDFAGCTPDQQDAILKQIQERPDFLTRLFFNQLVTLTLEGFLCDPVAGGNRDSVGWRFAGWEHQEPRSGFCIEEVDEP